MSFPPNLSVIVTKIYLPSLGVEANLNQSYWILTKTSKYLISKCYTQNGFTSCNLKMLPGFAFCCPRITYLSKMFSGGSFCSPPSLVVELSSFYKHSHLLTGWKLMKPLQVWDIFINQTWGNFYRQGLFLLYRNECLGLKVHSIEMLTCAASLNIAMITVSWYDIILHPSPIMFDKSALQLCYLTIARPIIAVWVWF